MYCIPLLLVTGKRPDKSVCIFLVSVFDSPIDANTQLLFSYRLGKNMFPSQVLIAPFLLIWCFSLFDPNFQKGSILILAGVRQLIMQWGLTMLQSFHSLQPWLNYIIQGWDLFHIKILLTIFGFSYRKYCSLDYFCCYPLVHLHFQLILGNTKIYYGGFSNLVVLYMFCKSRWHLLS